MKKVYVLIVALFVFVLVSCKKDEQFVSGDERFVVNGYCAVDLGLSVKWATCNVGASSQEGYGDYFDWDEAMSIVEWGDGWRLPTETEYEELLNNCIWIWTTQRGVSGYNVLSKNNDNSIFLPAAGWWDTMVLGRGLGEYWSSSFDDFFEDHARHLFFSDGNQNMSGLGTDVSISVRLVIE